MCERWGAREGKNDSWILKNFTGNAHIQALRVVLFAGQRTSNLGIAGPGLKKNNNNRFFLRFFFENPTRTVGCVTDAETLGAQGYTVGDQNATQLVKRRRKRKHGCSMAKYCFIY